MKKIKLLGFVLAILFGIFLVVYGGYDDSPGGQLLGLVVTIAGIVGIIKSRKKKMEKEEEKYPRIRSLKKTVSWRIIATLTTGIIVFLFTKELSETTYITLVSALVLMVFYYIHERIWSRIR